MDTLAPEIARHWGASATEPAVDQRKRDEDARAEEAQLEQLAERVSAARSVY